MKYYYAIFHKANDAVEVTFPDLEGCVTFGVTWDEAVENATDVLAGWLANAEPRFVKKPSSFEELRAQFKMGQIIPIPIDERIKQSYEEMKRFNVILPSGLLARLDEFRTKKGLKRSTLLKIAAEEYLQKKRESQ